MQNVDTFTQFHCVDRPIRIRRIVTHDLQHASKALQRLRGVVPLSGLLHIESEAHLASNWLGQRFQIAVGGSDPSERSQGLSGVKCFFRAGVLNVANQGAFRSYTECIKFDTDPQPKKPPVEVVLPLPNCGLKVVEKHIGSEQTLDQSAEDWAMAKRIGTTET